MTLTEKQQEHRQWLEGLRGLFPVQAEAALLLWDGLLKEVPNLRTPPAWVHEPDWTDCPNGISFHWSRGRFDTTDKVYLEPEVNEQGLVEWYGWAETTYADLPSDGEGGAAPVPPTEIPPEAIRLLRTYFTESEATSG